MIIGLNLMSKIIYILYYSQSGSVKSIANEIIKIFEELDPVDVEIKLMEAENIYAEKTYATIMSKDNSIDIDDQIDFNTAKVLLGIKFGKIIL